MTDTNVTIAAKRGCSDTGITEELATKLYIAGENEKSIELLAIVRFRAETVSKATNGSSRSVNLSVIELEPVVDGKLNGQLVDHIQEIKKVLGRNRAIAAGKDEALPFDDERDGPAPKVADLLQQGQAFLEHDEDGTPALHQPEEQLEPSPA